MASKAAGEVAGRRGESARSNRAEEVAELQIENKLDSFTNVPNEPVTTFTAHSQSGKREKEIDIEVAGGVLYLDTHGVARIERDEAIGLAKRLDRAVQSIR